MNIAFDEWTVKFDGLTVVFDKWTYSFVISTPFLTIRNYIWWIDTLLEIQTLYFTYLYIFKWWTLYLTDRYHSWLMDILLDGWTH